ncbi:Superoxide dismutase [Aphelenchoides besseyi]|nr:Superoxide dismutase [Aphelenchoides besseyi]KAI6199641.1 Superoxide dismutase [Aphelenchoides besseyi]
MKISIVLFSFFAIALADERHATVKLIRFENDKEVDSGHLQLLQKDGKLTIVGKITGLTAGEHGFHIHEKGSTGNKCLDAGPHFNPQNKSHGGPEDSERHIGDLGNILADENGVAVINISDSLAQLDGEHGILKRSVVVHEKADDLGKGASPDSKKTGNSGTRVACGIIDGGSISTTTEASFDEKIAANFFLAMISAFVLMIV